MKKIFFLMLTLLIMSVASMNAQVLIGGDGTGNPDPAAVLELRSANLGLLLPRVALQSTTDKATIPNPVAGLAVYNTATTGTGATAVVPGIYVFTGTAWTLQAPPVIITQPKSFSWSRLYEKDGDPNSTVTEFSPVLTVVASGAGLTYQWYKKAINKNAADTLLTSETTPTYTPTVTAWGMNSYYCVVSNAYGSVKSDVADVAAGCGAKTVSGGWLKFMCYNLGADRTKNPFIYDADILGSFYQWGRSEPIARTIAVPANFIKTTAYPNDWKIPAGYNTDFSDSYHPDDYLWRHHKNGDIDPCPAGWHVPAQTAFAAIFKGTADSDIYENAIANTWTPTGNWTETSGNGGNAVKPDGSTTTLFFPSTGWRDESTGVLRGVGQFGNYWSSNIGASGAYYFSTNDARLFLGYLGSRGRGFSVRCVSE